MNVPEVDLHKLTVSDPFLGQYQRLVRDVVIPYQWDALNDRIPEADPSHAIENFRIAAKRQSGEFYGMVFQDSDVAKWLEAVAWSLCQKPDPELEKTADDVIALVAAAQCADGYLNTYFTVKAPQERWNNLAECHELYCAGHMIEAGVAFFQATGKRRLLEVVCRLADHIDSVFGPGENQLHGYPGHPEIELALMRLYEITQQPRYMALADYFVEQRGTQPHYYDEEYEKRGKTAYWHTYGPAWMVKDKAYSQAHLPLSAQQTATGHAVRFVYLMAGVAHLARLSQDEDKRQTCLRLWNNMAQRQLYITGGIGSQSSGEAFSSDYDLPNDTVYAESCASIGLMMFARRMLEMEADSRYADVMERALYNTVLGGMALDGKHFFYVNPLEVHPKTLTFNHIYDHVKPVRQRWFGCACCPPNIARVLTSLGHYLYTPRNEALYINMYVGNSVEIPLENGALKLRISGNYPWHEQITITVESSQPLRHTFALRLPEWCPQPQVEVNGQPVEQDIRKGYLHIHRDWQEGDTIALTLPMPVRRVYGNPLVRHTAGKVAVQRGPLIYCLEQADNGEALHNLWLPKESKFNAFEGKGLFANQMLIQAEGVRRGTTETPPQALWHFDAAPGTAQPHTLTFIPWFSWANRGEGEMRIWVNEL
ncbi:glycoside hydrolase family 127 protein [Salmonella enterica subsp. houtenae]|uniref:Glycoside hydrolase family 127 protein n=2 Tax=Salmonella houtenae TaxID=59205 RepID=A0A5Y6M2Y0_SALHO|nr:glycoside hydrolase family 127 protein [Salmonella enterica subsp. enterica]EAW0936282.1 glycoside hydrolase family 127 protein [Salmonella enterica]EBF8286787.1 glycoside hydrolase family 127 protein [Salmonella enterica subsp. houtenae]EBQ5981178.1 glycoside hydrolase family 127 protein [Salmonella enterica subsp. houtenae serovar Houten]EDS4966195.1 glycoside hydrolase family 127 protein [Salmonella enterica subsp. enterica serovar O rough]EHA4050566.1 glycoside hydrolase family 127 prot